MWNPGVTSSKKTPKTSDSSTSNVPSPNARNPLFPPPPESCQPESDEQTPAADQGVNRINQQTELKQSYLEYAIALIVARALPDVRDGLHPVPRRAIYAMFDGGYR